MGDYKLPKEQDKIRAEMMKWSRKKYAWENTALSWNKEFKDAVSAVRR